MDDRSKCRFPGSGMIGRIRQASQWGRRSAGPKVLATIDSLVSIVKRKEES